MSPDAADYEEYLEELPEGGTRLRWRLAGSDLSQTESTNGSGPSQADPGPDWYMLWIDDGTGPDGGGFFAIHLSDIQGDGQVHEIRRDLRKFNPQGDLFYFAVGVASGPKGSAIFDLFEIRFEPENGSPSD